MEICDAKVIQCHFKDTTARVIGALGNLNEFLQLLREAHKRFRRTASENLLQKKRVSGIPLCNESDLASVKKNEMLYI